MARSDNHSARPEGKKESDLVIIQSTQTWSLRWWSSEKKAVARNSNWLTDKQSECHLRGDRTISSLIDWSIGWSPKAMKRKIWVYQWLLTFKLYHLKTSSSKKRNTMVWWPVTQKELFNRSTSAWSTQSVLIIILWLYHLIRSLRLYLNHTHNVLRGYFALLSD